VNRDLRQAGGILINKGSRVLGFKESRVVYFVLNVFTGTLEPFDKPFDKSFDRLMIPSHTEGLTVPSEVEGPWNP
jgi:hypothetical protein